MCDLNEVKGMKLKMKELQKEYETMKEEQKISKKK